MCDMSSQSLQEKGESQMKLIDFLNQRIETEPDYAERILKIGSSTGYFYCGTSENFIKKIGSYDISINKFFCSAAASYYSQYEQQLKNPPKIVDYAEEILRSSSALFSIEEFENRIIDWFISTRNRYSAAKNAETIAKETKPLAEREVIESRMADAIVDEGVEIILIEGYEKGGIWMSSETAEKGEFTFSLADENSENERE